MELATTWGRALDVLRGRLSAGDVDTWFSSAQPRSIEGDQVELELLNRYYCEWIAENYLADLTAALSIVCDRPMTVSLTAADERAEAVPASLSASRSGDRAVGLNPHQTFDSFVVGPCNAFAHGGARAVADRPAAAYNPLFIYGDTGLGKTHLMHAIGNHLIANVPDARVIYATAEDFANEMINCIQHKRMEDFREKYRHRATVLLIDDVQFLSGRDRTMEEFFHTFNALKNAGRQIVLTSDKEPKDIDKLEARLRTRFEGGLLADVQPPDPETLMAILRSKAELRNLSLPPDVVEAIAHGAQGNIRELEGILNQIGALQSFYGSDITLPVLRSRLPKLFRAQVTQVTVPGIIEAVARMYNLRSADITGASKTRTLTGPRHVAMFLARRHTSLSFPELGREFGNRDHSTIQHGVRQTETNLAKDPELAHKIKMIEQQLKLRT